MSRIYFTSENEETEVSGRERAHFGNLISNIGAFPLASLCVSYTNSPPKIIDLLPEDCYIREMYNTDRTIDVDKMFRSWFRGAWSDDDVLIVDNKKYNCFDIALNTAMAIGSDPIKLAARIHGQCEIHAYIEGVNRGWVASIIEQGIDVDVYRKDEGWEPTITMLRADDTSPVVLSYSVCDGFPDQRYANYDDDDTWYDLTSHERWALSMDGLRKQDSGLEIRPDYWDNYRFTNVVNSFTILEMVYK